MSQPQLAAIQAEVEKLKQAQPQLDLSALESAVAAAQASAAAPSAEPFSEPQPEPEASV